MNPDFDVRAAYTCVAEVVRRRVRCGEPVPAWLRAHYARLDVQVRLSPPRQDPEGSGAESEEWIGSSDAATLLGWTTRQVQRLAADLDGRIVAGRWMFRTDTVCAYREACDGSTGSRDRGDAGGTV